MARERISSNVQRKTSQQVTEAAEALDISVSKYIEIAIETELGNLDTQKESKRLKEGLVHERDTARVERDKAQAARQEAQRQRDHFKAKFEDALTDLNAAEAKIEALKNRGLLARIFNLNPKI